MAPASSKSTKSPSFQFYAFDFLLSRRVRRMSMTERGVYITLLAMSWGEGSLPANLDDLAVDCGMKPDQFRRMWERGPLHECFVERNGRLTNPRLESERRKQIEYRKKQAENGAKGGRPGKAVGLDEEPKPKLSTRLVSDPLDSSPVDSGESAEPPSDSTPVLDFPTVGASHRWALTQSRVDGWVAIYPNVDVIAECRKALAWVEANPERRKTSKGMSAFLVNWLNRAVDRGGRGAAAPSRTAGNVEALQRFANRGRTV